MKVVEERLKGNEGEIKLIPENLDDIWHLKHIIEPGDVVFAYTKRISESSDKLRSDKEKITVRLGIKVEKVEFHKFANRLRVSGIIVAGIEDSGHHTLNIGIGTEVSIIKRWRAEQLRRIERAIEASKRPEIIIVVIEEGEAVIGALREWGVEEIATISRSYGKGLADYRNEFFGELLSTLKSMDFRYAVIAGPGFAKEDFIEFVRQREALLAKKLVKADVSSTGRRGFVEVLKRGIISKIVGDLRLAEETEYIEKLLAEISKDGKAVYGLKEVEKAFSYGAIDVLLLTDEYLLKEREKWDVDSFLEEVEKVGRILIVSSEFEPGKQLNALGGIAALLRFPIA
ncbi:MAG: mRNA surveillance protein pelota [Archaeoglobus sp.]|nr:mRNA surveillance protein pelota [Archaeoglobus sp.]